MASKYYSGQEHLKKRSRDAARCRRGQQNDEYSELAHQLPLSQKDASQLDRLSVMRLASSFIKVKHFLKKIVEKDASNQIVKQEMDNPDDLEKQLLMALDGFVFVIGPDGHCLYVSDNVTTYLGLIPVEVIGNSFYKFIHPCDHEEVAKELDGKIPLEDMEIFDGLFCSDSVFLMSNNLKGGSAKKRDNDRQPYRSFFVRMKSTLTSRGKNVNLKASTYRVVHCMGCMKLCGGDKANKVSFVGIGVPLMFTPTFEVPLDRCTFTSHHTLDLKFIYCEEWIEDILGYPPEDVLGHSLYEIHHGRDSDVLTNCHKTLLTKGQSVSGYYRLLANCGGWVWVQTKASIVYASKSCQPQFVLCVHYAISGVQKDEYVVSLDQLRGATQRQRSPSNSPTSDKSRAIHTKEVRGNNMDLDTLSTTRHLDLAKQDNQDGDSTDALYMSINLMSEEDDLDYDGCSVEGLSVASSSVEATHNHEISFYDQTKAGGSEHCAPFIPPPLVDSPFLSGWTNFTPVLSRLSTDDRMLLSTLQWEVCDSKHTEYGTKRNLSTPKFYPELMDDLPVLKREEIEMSTPIQNLPLLQGNEIWFALDQTKEVA